MYLTIPAILLLAAALSGCSSTGIEQAAYKSAAGQGNGIEALTSPSTEARLGLK